MLVDRPAIQARGDGQPQAYAKYNPAARNDQSKVALANGGGVVADET